jgi:hypothetical protein
MIGTASAGPCDTHLARLPRLGYWSRCAHHALEFVNQGRPQCFGKLYLTDLVLPFSDRPPLLLIPFAALPDSLDILSLVAPIKESPDRSYSAWDYGGAMAGGSHGPVMKSWRGASSLLMARLTADIPTVIKPARWAGSTKLTTSPDPRPHSARIRGTPDAPSRLLLAL